jgi:hypothetical protein
VALYGCETWSLTLREEHRLRVFENTVLRRISGLKRDEVTGGWRKLHNEELHDLYSSPSIIRIINPASNGLSTQQFLFSSSDVIIHNMFWSYNHHQAAYNSTLS